MAVAADLVGTTLAYYNISVSKSMQLLTVHFVVSPQRKQAAMKEAMKRCCEVNQKITSQLPVYQNFSIDRLFSSKYNIVLQVDTLPMGRLEGKG